mmetsp:Transcript_11538/g.34177  ORF Transcript_11538/g.34177 Transcript_11538/m.34177 type:complete len:352 (-) Transcript_11538:1348-2403(-)
MRPLLEPDGHGGAAAQAAPQPHAPQQQVLRGGVWPAHLGGHVNGPAVRVAHQPDGGDCADRAPDTGQPPDSHAQVHQDLVAAGAERPVGPDTDRARAHPGRPHARGHVAVADGRAAARQADAAGGGALGAVPGGAVAVDGGARVLAPSVISTQEAYGPRPAAQRAHFQVLVMDGRRPRRQPQRDERGHSARRVPRALDGRGPVLQGGRGASLRAVHEPVLPRCMASRVQHHAPRPDAPRGVRHEHRRQRGPLQGQLPGRQPQARARTPVHEDAQAHRGPQRRRVRGAQGHHAKQRAKLQHAAAARHGAPRLAGAGRAGAGHVAARVGGRLGVCSRARGHHGGQPRGVMRRL